MRSTRFTIFLCLVLATAPIGVTLASGTSGSQFLGVGVGARTMGMGGAAVSLADDGTALFWNPAGLAQAPGHTFSLSHVSWFGDASYQYASYSLPLGERGALGLAIEQGSVSWDNTGEGTFEAGDFMGAVGYARRLRPNLGVGGSLKYIAGSLGDDEASSYAFDLGAVYRLSEAATLGAAVRNMGAAVSYRDAEDPLPATIVVGGSLAWRSLLFAVDVEKVNDLEAATRAGVEFRPIRHLALRGGVIAGTESALSPVMGGVGVDWGERWSADYAYRPSDLGGTHQFALSAGLGVGTGLSVAGAAGETDGMREVRVPKSNLTVVTELASEVVAEAVGKMRIPEASELYIKQVDQHDASWLVQSVLLEELTKRGHIVKAGGMAGEPSDPEGRPRYEVAYRIVSAETTYPRAWREWMVGAKKVERRVAVDIHFQLSDAASAIIWAGNVQRERREIVPGSRIAELSSPGQAFTSPEVIPGSWDKVLEPVIVAAIVGGLIYLFYTSRSSS